MARHVLKQLGLLLWKNFLLQKRKVFVTFLEIGLPTFFAILLILVRQRVVATHILSPTTWEDFTVTRLPDHLCPPPYPILPFCGRWTLYYTPESNVAHSLMRRVQSQLGNDRINNVVGFASEQQMVDKFLKELETCHGGRGICPTLAAVVFPNTTENATQVPKKMEYQLRFPFTLRKGSSKLQLLNPLMDSSNWNTQFQFPLFQKVGPRAKNSSVGGSPDYYNEGFLALQYNMDKAITAEVMNMTGTPPSIMTTVRRFPYPHYNDDNFVLVLQQQLPFIILLSFIFSALQIVKDVVYEKERKLKESMKMMGLSNWLHWTAWFIKYLLFIGISVGLMTLFFCVPVGQYGSVVGYTSASVLFVFLLLYAIATINFCFLVSVFFSKANSAAAAGGIFFFVSYIPYIFLQPRYDTLPWVAKVAPCALSNVAMSMGAQIIGMFEGTGEGVQWSSVSQGVSVDDNFSMLNVWLMLLLDALLYGMLAWYIEAVWPGEFGVPLPWYFPFKKSYWCGSVPRDEAADPETTPLLSSGQESCQDSENSGFMETGPSQLKPGIKIRNLTKVFKSGAQTNTAVNAVTLNIHQGQITALLGHNGAGKTTLMSMLTGFYPPTSGTATVNGCDIRTDMSGVRHSLGLCPQHDVLFDSLTVEEHLEFFAKLKGCPEVKGEINEMLDSLGLRHKREAQVKTLSGGLKRKLSVGIALIGGSKVVVLDEPTSGMDPNARRHLWDILQRHRAGRTILLTTHFMDEADVLGDRIAIMAAGVIQCCGTPLFLKNKYGAGYHLVTVKQPDCDEDAVLRALQNHVTDARVESNVGAELSFLLPHESKTHFEALFTDLEGRREELKIASYGVSVTTMEEVFLKVGESSDDTLKHRLQNNGSYGSIQRHQSVTARHFKTNTGVRLYAQQFVAMFMKHVLHTWRNWKVTLAQLLVPLYFAIAALVLLKTLPQAEDSPPLVLNTAPFDSNVVAFASDGHAETAAMAALYGRQFAGTHSHPKYLNNATAWKDDPSLETFLIFQANRSLSTYTNHYLIAAEFREKSPATGNSSAELEVTAHFNGQSFHSAAQSLSALGNAVLQHAAGPEYNIRAVNAPLPRTTEDLINAQIKEMYMGFTISFNIIFGMAFLASSFVLFVIKERAVKAKHGQFVSGAHTSTFWLSAFAWDMLAFLVPCLALLATFAAFGITAYVDEGRCWYLLLLFVLYGWAILPFMYLLSFIFTVPSTGLVWLTMFNILSGIATTLAVNILRIPALNTVDIARALEWAFLTLLPNFCLGQGLSDLYENYEFLKVCGQPGIAEYCKQNLTSPCCPGNCGDTCVDFNPDYLSWQPGGIGRMLAFLAFQGILYFAALFLLESRLIQSLWYRIRPGRNGARVTRSPSAGKSPAVREDGDVAMERERVASSASLPVSEALVLRDLTKFYDGLLAVDGLSVAIPRGECFGLLGINGAGKTSTFKMLTGDEIVSSGDAHLDGFSIRSDMDHVRRQLGYCPQFDALIDQLTGRETLTLYARLRGVEEAAIPSLVHDLIRSLLLQEHADKLVQNYSGGNKRKLSTAVALVGDPPVVFLDEPSTGMDPVARRMLWDTLADLRQRGTTLILTSHSMEECEALCTRLAIMVNGQFKCLGGIQHLKNKFGEGFSLVVKVGVSGPGVGAGAGALPGAEAGGVGVGEPRTQPVMEYIAQVFPGCQLKDVHQGMLHYHLPDPTLPWAHLFRALEEGRRLLPIEDYSVSQTTLEQVFINFARAQRPPREGTIGRCGAICRACCGGCCRCRHGDDNADTEDDLGEVQA